VGRLHDIRVKSNQFVANMNVHIAMSIESVERELVDLNKRQMLGSADSENKPLIHAKTGSEYLSKAYAKRTRKSKPNLFVDGTFQGEMFIEVNENNNTFFIDSFWSKTKHLVTNYGKKLFGIFNKSRAKQLTGLAFKRKYESLVLR